MPEAGPDNGSTPGPQDDTPRIPPCSSGPEAPTEAAPPAETSSDVPVTNPDPGATAEYWTPARRAASKPKDRRRGE